MQIANPIYDVVFKYLMEDSKVAKILLSAIIGLEISELDFRPQEYSTHIGRTHARRKKRTSPVELQHGISIYRLDFAAKIKTEEGFRLVILEIQKARFVQDIMRFRRYLGEQYSNNENSILSHTKNGRRIRVGIPIISVYFLGEGFEHLQNVPVIKVNRKVLDAYSGNEIVEKEEFIESLTHDSIIVSIPSLSKRRRNELEILLSVFDQTNRDASHHILNVEEEEFPEKYQDIIRRLKKAASQPEMRKKMELEDDMVEEFAEMDRLLEEKEQELAEESVALEEKEQALAQTQQALNEMQKELENLKRQLKKE